jgi:hypothetical protein
MVFVRRYSMTDGRLSRFACGRGERQSSLGMHRKTLKQHIFSRTAIRSSRLQAGPEFSEIKRAEQLPAK